jgi:hypothetical protein
VTSYEEREREREGQIRRHNKGVLHITRDVALPFTLKSILRQTKDYGNSNISPCKNISIFKNPLKETKIFQEIITLSIKLFSSFNTSQKKIHLSKILI